MLLLRLADSWSLAQQACWALLLITMMKQANAETISSITTTIEVTDEQCQYQANVSYWPGWANFPSKQEAAQAELDASSIPTNCIWGDSPRLTGLYVDNAYGTVDALAEGYRGYCPSTYGYHNEYYTSWIGISRVAGCHPTTTWNGSGCVATTYTCPTTGIWTLSADKQTCTGCRDVSQVLDQHNACVSKEDTELGPTCASQPNNNNLPFWSAS